MRRALELFSRSRLSLLTTVVALAVGSAGLIQPLDVHLADAGDPVSPNSAAIAAATAVDSTFTERRTSQRPDVLLLTLIVACVVWAYRRQEEHVDDRLSVTASYGISVPVRDRGPPLLLIG